MPPHGRLPSNSCIGRAARDVPNLPALLLWGTSDTALAFRSSPASERIYEEIEDSGAFDSLIYPSVVTERNHRVDVRGFSSWKIAGEERHHCERENHSCERNRVCGSCAEK